MFWAWKPRGIVYSCLSICQIRFYWCGELQIGVSATLVYWKTGFLKTKKNKSSKIYGCGSSGNTSKQLEEFNLSSLFWRIGMSETHLTDGTKSYPTTHSCHRKTINQNVLRCFMTMQLLLGLNLYRHLKRGPIPQIHFEEIAQKFKVHSM